MITLQKIEVTANADFAHAHRRSQVFNRQSPVTAQAVQNRSPRSLQDVFNRRYHAYIVESRTTFVNQTISKRPDHRPFFESEEPAIKRAGGTFYRCASVSHW